MNFRRDRRRALVPYAVTIKKAASEQFATRLPENAALAVLEYLSGPLSYDPHGEGDRMERPLSHFHYADHEGVRILYEIDDEDLLVTVCAVDAK